MEIRNVAVAGAGTMGNGIAHVFAQKGYNVTLMDSTPDSLLRGVEMIKLNLARQVKRELISKADADATLARVNATGNLKEAASAQLIVEAIFEDYDVKTAFWKEMDAICSSDTIFASNTSSLPITQLAAATKRPEQFIGMHFMNPVPVMKLVEIIRGFPTSDETCAIIKDLAMKLDKTPVEVNDYPGFIANRILLPMINESIYALMEGVSGKEEIDTVMKLGMNHPMGPLTLADFIGLDVCLAILETMHNGLGDPKYRPCPLLKKMVQAGWLGRKSGRGFYIYGSATN
ncbi:MAG: 3-hydroxybutyryl-CoA dehydrogenase [bacterium]|nr:3-hydroxybutyryl-CoA dehydrogenase [bacterium]